MSSKDSKATDPKMKTDKPSKTESKTTDKMKLKASTDKKLDSLMHSMSEKEGNLSQLASDFYEGDSGPSYMPRGPHHRMNI